MTRAALLAALTRERFGDIHQLTAERFAPIPPYVEGACDNGPTVSLLHIEAAERLHAAHAERRQEAA